MEISIDSAKKDKLFYVVPTGIIYRDSDKKCLILQRSFDEIAYKGLWEGVGGKSEHGDLLANEPVIGSADTPEWPDLLFIILSREAREESGLEVVDRRWLSDTFFVRPDGVPVYCPHFALRYVSGEVKLSADHIDHAWVNAEEAKGYDLIEGMMKEIEETIELYSTPSR